MFIIIFNFLDILNKFLYFINTYFCNIIIINIFVCLWTASVREQSAVRGRELLSGREGKGEVISLNVALKEGVDVGIPVVRGR